MTFFAPLFLRNSLEDPLVPISSERIAEVLGATPTDAGVDVTPSKSLAMSAVWRAVNLLAGTLGSLPLHPYRKLASGGRELVTSGQAAQLLDNPHRDMTPFELWELVMAHVLLWGNAYLWLVRDQNNKPLFFEGIHPSRVKPGRTSDGTKVYAIDGGKIVATDVRLESSRVVGELLHIPGFSVDGIVGLSPIAMARQGIGLALAAEQYGAKLFGSGSLATGVLETDRKLTEDQANAVMTRWKTKRAGMKSAHEVIVLDSGAKFHQLTIPPVEAQFLESRRFQVSEIARMFGVPPHMLMDTEKSTSWGTGIEQQSIGFVVYTLRPWLTRIEQRVTRVLKPEPVYARFSVEGLLRGDSKQRADFYRSMWEIGALSTNDVRALEEQEPVEGGDVRYVPLNFGALGATQDDAETDAPPASPRLWPC